MLSQRESRSRELQSATQSTPTQATQSTASPSGSSSGSFPSISLPSGGGALRGIGEKLNVNAATGTATLSIPIPTSSSRALNPDLSLTYDSGNGNGVFGLGWNLSIPSITRKTEKGIPHYRDSIDSDVFILTGEEDLVPIFKRDENGGILVDHITGDPVIQEEVCDGYVIRRYSPRVDQSFSRIERWTKQTAPNRGYIHWCTITSDNITNVYGRDDNSRIYEQNTETEGPRIFSWLISETYDTRGNAVVYKYKAENSVGVCLGQPHEANRSDHARFANRYLKSIKYGNTTPNRDQNSWKAFSPFDLTEQDWLFTVAFDYGEHDNEFPQLNDDGPWLCRKDPFSSYRSGFEIRTYRLCQRILMFHHFPSNLPLQDYLVNSINLTHDENPSFTYLTSVCQVGYLLNETNNRYLSKSLPPVEFEYSKFPSDDELSRLQLKEIDPVSLQNVPYGVDGQRYRWIDIDGEGLSGALTEQATGWFYKRNLSANNQCEDHNHKTREIIAKLGPIEQVCRKPAPSLDSNRSFFADVEGDGLMDLVRIDDNVWGYYTRQYVREQVQGWMPFHEFKMFPNVSVSDANLRFIDLTGDGLPDIMITEDQAFLWFPSLGADGYGEEYRTAQSLDENKGPRLMFADPEQTIHLADMSGDSLPDLVRIRNGEICYWPNTGYGTFGAKVTMDNSPWFAENGQFDQKCIQIADIDGSGTSDIIYISAGGIGIYLNQAGNGFSDRKLLPIFVGGSATVDTVDLLGTGTISLVWSSALPGDMKTPMKYLDITNGIKPHLLIGKNNNIGAQTRIHYAPSTKFYLDDRERGRLWITRLPFPVQCVEKVEIFDQVSHHRFVNRYAYHHGYFDGYEREYRGFAMVEQWDTEEFGVMSTDFEEPAINVDSTWHVPPVYTKTWFHNGAFLDDGSISRFLAGEYFGAPSAKDCELYGEFLNTILDDSYIPPGLNYEETRESCRALAGRILRQEIYGEDGDSKSQIPYTVAESNYSVQVLQNREDLHRHSIITVHPRETIALNYERNLDDPRTNHTLVLEVDDYGNVLKQVDVAYGRKCGATALTETARLVQEQALITYSEHDYTDKIDKSNDHLLPQGYHSRTYELYGFVPQGARFRQFQFTQDNFAPLLQLVEIPFDEEGVYGQKRQIQQSRTVYRSNDLSKLLPLGKIETMALVGETYTLAFSPGLVSKIYRRQGDDNRMEDLIPNIEIISGKGGSSGGYLDLDSDGSWWIPSGRSYFSPGVNSENELQEAKKHFFIVRQQTDPFGNRSIADFDAYDLLVTRVIDAADNTTGANIDYRVLKPFLVTDPNGNRTQCAFDELGYVIGTAMMGKANENVGDSLEGFPTVLTEDEMDRYFKDPKGPIGIKLLANATTRFIYDFSRFFRNKLEKKPAYCSSIARETHSHEQTSIDIKTQISFCYIDGFQRQVQKKIQAAPETEGGRIRWIGSGWTEFNNKGLPVRRYEPFFDESHDFNFAQKIGVSPYIFYDPLGRVVGTLNPNHTWTKSAFSSWHIDVYDENDTIMIDPRRDNDIGPYMRLLSESDYLPTWFDLRDNGAMGREEQQAARKSVSHANTPTLRYFDPLGREFFSIADNGTNGKYRTQTTVDVQGNQKQIRDPKDRIVIRYDHDMLGNIIHQSSMESGQRWELKDVTGMVIYNWNSRMDRIRTQCDSLRRPIESYLQHDSGPELLVERTLYGEMTADPEKRNARTRVVQMFDQAGMAINGEYDFKGNLLSRHRQLAKEYKATRDWNFQIALEESLYTNASTYDALNRVVETIAPDKSRTRRCYNETGLITHIDSDIQGELPAVPYVKIIRYNAKGQRIDIQYGNDVSTTYSYDPLTFRLVYLKTTRSPRRFPNDCKRPHPVGWPGCQIQNLHYTYDPVGNITYVRDDAQQTVFFRNQRVDPSNEFTYDALYQLIEATGREHIALGIPSNVSASSFDSGTRFTHPHDGKAMSRYVERYNYDQLGNFLSVQHRGNDATHPGWTRHYTYSESSQIEPGKQSNRLSQTMIGSVTDKYHYDGEAGKQGNITAMPNLPLMKWDYKDQLQATAKQVVKDGLPETTWYVYDSAGQRVRKVTERQTTIPETARRLKERIYLEGSDLYRKYDGDGDNVTFGQNTLTIMDDEARIALVEYRTDGQGEQTKTRYQITNHILSVTLELDSHGELISYEDYTAYGNTSYYFATSPKRYRYTGKERDKENGFHYYGRRYYYPAIGRWINCDPIGVADGLNVYAYVRCNPVNMLDPNGTGRRGRRRARNPSNVQSSVPSGSSSGVSPEAQEGENNPIAELKEEFVDEVASGAVEELIIGGGSAGFGALEGARDVVVGTVINAVSRKLIVGNSNSKIAAAAASTVAEASVTAVGMALGGEGLSPAGIFGGAVVGLVKSDPVKTLVKENLPRLANAVEEASKTTLGGVAIGGAVAVGAGIGEIIAGEELSVNALLFAGAWGMLTSDPVKAFVGGKLRSLKQAGASIASAVLSAIGR